MNYSEEIAQVVIERLCPGSRMQFRADQSTSVPDFDLYFTNGIRGVVEVTESVDRPWLETHKTIERRKSLPAKRCRKSWAVHLGVKPTPKDKPNLKDARGIDDALAILEENGLDQFPPIQCDALRALEPIYEIMQGLRIDGAWAVDSPDGKPRIGFLSPSRGGSVSYETFERAVDNEARKTDNLWKLSLGDRPERHLFVLLTSLNILPWRLVVRSIPSKTTQPWDIGSSPPPEAPSIPREITHIWAVAITDFGDEAVVWRVENGKRWAVLGKVEVPAPKAPIEA